MKYLFYALAIIGLIQLGACVIVDDDDFDCKKGNGHVITREIFVPEFDKIHLNGSADVYITQGHHRRVVVEIDENLLDDIDRDVYRGVWEIEIDRCVSRIEEFNVFITTPHITEVVLNGSGQILGENTIHEDELMVEINGSGDVDLAFEGEEVHVKVDGSGDLFLEGSVDLLTHSVDGSGDLEAFELFAEEVFIDVFGSGDSEVWADDLLDVRIEGSGDVFYIGDPVLNIDINGSGRVIKKN